MISKEEIKKLADLARIEIKDEEAGSLGGEMDAILDYVKSIQEFHSDEGLESPPLNVRGGLGVLRICDNISICKRSYFQESNQPAGRI